MPPLRRYYFVFFLSCLRVIRTRYFDAAAALIFATRHIFAATPLRYH